MPLAVSPLFWQAAPMHPSPLLALELGGTKTVAAIGGPGGQVIEEIRFPTTSPAETLARAIDWWRDRSGGSKPAGIGVASFGPIRVAPQAADFGHMLATPKPGWAGFPVAGHLRDAFPGTPFALDTDVNAAALAEARLGAATGRDDVAYITIGTGIGAGILSGGRLVHGALHPEFGHLRVPRHPDDTFAGVCPFHRDCLEGMASGPAIEHRWGMGGHALPAGHPAWEMEAWYLAHGILCLAAIVCPAVVVLGGGVSQADGLHDLVMARLRDLSNGYYEAAEAPRHVVPPALGQQAGIAGALLLAEHSAA